MLDQIIKLTQENTQKEVVNNANVPDQLNNQVVQTLAGSLVGGLQQEAQNGNISGLMSLFSGQTASSASLMNHPIVSTIANSAVRSLTEKVGLPSGVASSIASAVIPAVLAALVRKFQNPGEGGFNLKELLGTLSSGQGGLGGDALRDALADGKLDMNDLTRIGGSLLGGSKKTGNKSDQGPDLGGLLGGLFGKK